jgi:hypothetical protein
MFDEWVYPKSATLLGTKARRLERNGMGALHLTPAPA